MSTQPVEPPTPSQVIATPDSPPSNPVIQSHRKGGRPPNRKGKLGKNQYTKDKDPPDTNDRSPNRSQSRDAQRDDNGFQTSKASTHDGRHAKSKNGGSKVSMTEMKKRVAAILEFISRTQVEMATETPSPGRSQAAESLLRGVVDNLPMITLNGTSGGGFAEQTTEGSSSTKEFKDLSCLEMMDVLTRQLVRWQKEFT